MFDMNMMKKIQDMKAQLEQGMKEAQEKLGEARVEGCAQNLVRVVMNGHQEPQSVAIEEEAFADGDKELFEDLVLAAMKDAYVKSKTLQEETMASVTQGFPMPPGMNPFG